MSGKGSPFRSARHVAFGRAVREWRVRRDLSQEGLGFASGLHRNYVGAIERGELNPTLGVVLKLADGLQVAPSELHRLAEERLSEVAARIDSRGG